MTSDCVGKTQSI